MSTVSNSHISNWYNEGTKKCTKSTHLYIRHIFRIFPNRNTIKSLFGYVCCNPYIPIEVKSKSPSNPDNQPTKAINNFANYTYVNPIFSLLFFFSVLYWWMNIKKETLLDIISSIFTKMNFIKTSKCQNAE